MDEKLDVKNVIVICVVERPIKEDEKIKNALIQWGSDVEDVVFLLKQKRSSKQVLLCYM